MTGPALLDGLAFIEAPVDPDGRARAIGGAIDAAWNGGLAGLEALPPIVLSEAEMLVLGGAVGDALDAWGDLQ